VSFSERSERVVDKKENKVSLPRQCLGMKPKRFYNEVHEGHEEKRLNSLTTRSLWSLKNTKSTKKNMPPAASFLFVVLPPCASIS